MKRGKVICLIIAALCFLAAGILLFLAWRENMQRQATSEMYEEMRQEVRSDLEWETEAEAEETGETEELIIPVDFETLWETNAEIYAWITIPGTEIDYPVLQSSTDDTWYLTRDAAGEESSVGAIFSEMANSTDFSDPNTVLYGHNMKDGSMFAGLHDYEDEEFFNQHRQVNIYTPDAIRYYRVFAAYLYDSRHLLESFDLSDPDVFEDYIESIMNQRNLVCQVDQDMDIEAGDRILTLSTCHSRGSSYRYLVQAVLVKEVTK